MYFLCWGITAPLLYYGAYLVLKKPQYGIMPGDIVKLIGVFGNIGISVAMCVSIVDDMRKASIAAAKLLAVVDRRPDHDRKAGKTLKDVKGKIEFNNVSFKYKTREDYAVKNLSFTINEGETVALVGESGCGKTTTLQLLQRFYEIESGEILIDEQNISQYSQVSVRKHIAIVPQGPVLFSMSVLDNIRFGKPKSTEQETIEASQIGNAHNFIMEMPDNYKTEVKQMSLSGGQKQRICISRAILNNTPILLLDEATAALDTESEQLVQESLERFRHGKTAIVVAHRLSTVKNADRILVFQNGHIAESGTHEELLVKSGIYSDLVKFQLQ
ncbi:ABC transporter family protein [Tritrichomonas foetus]|uniref:ABC transporter family protein n=1 Tax=Tritrichomonas foetus TaxID=1144522 RepID=A0A1J4KS39_9EUKA|nr:ABC transporter family protein [Tritrichomonas foetus]|eukprot:OHT13696.1 ABC transporter family protein [Tritrichomonas foetus]